MTPEPTVADHASSVGDADPPRPWPGAEPVGERLRRLAADPRAGALALALVAVAAGAWWFRTATAEPSPDPVTATAPPGSVPPAPEPVGTDGGTDPDPTAPVASSAPGRPIAVVVHVAGAVARPGVVTLPDGARVVDAIDAAGGAVPEADLDRLNLAAVLADGQRVVVARQGDPPTPAEPDPAPGGVATDPATSGPIDLNVATAEQLDTLPGIGPTLAAAILEERDRRGGFTEVGQLLSVPGIGEGRLARIRELVAVGP